MEAKWPGRNPYIPRLTNHLDAQLLHKWAVTECLSYGGAATLMTSEYIAFPVTDDTVPEITNPLNFESKRLTAEEAEILNGRRNNYGLWGKMVLGMSDNAFVHKEFIYTEGMTGDATGIVGMTFDIADEIYAGLKEQAGIEGKTVVDLFSKLIRVYDLRRQPLDTAK